MADKSPDTTLSEITETVKTAFANAIVELSNLQRRMRTGQPVNHQELHEVVEKFVTAQNDVVTRLDDHQTATIAAASPPESESKPEPEPGSDDYAVAHILDGPTNLPVTDDIPEYLSGTPANYNPTETPAVLPSSPEPGNPVAETSTPSGPVTTSPDPGPTIVIPTPDTGPIR